MIPGAQGMGEDCFSMSWESSADFCADIQFAAHMEQNRDWDIMTVWCNGGRQNGENY